ncbi:hypothetical protein EJ04DRAFT_423289, partial [Polyplosphaeria fusca]
RNIKAGFAASGLVPFNPDRVLRDILKPPSALTIPRVDGANAEPCLQAKVLQTPVTPATPVSAGALTSLQDYIVNEHARSLDDRSKQNFERHIQKLVKATQICLTNSALQQDQIRFLIRINNEAKVRRSARRDILAKGEGKVMSFEDLEAVRAARAAKGQAKAEGKGKRGRKRKTQADAEAMKSSTKAARTGDIQPEDEIELESWRAPVARMW